MYEIIAEKKTSKCTEFLIDKIDKEYSDHGISSTYAFYVYDTKDHIIAGCSGQMIYEAIYIDQLWVDKDYRKQGIASQLLETVHKLGRDSGCKFSTVDTMSFQTAIPFYTKMGYVIVGAIEGYVGNSSCIFLRKPL